MSRLPSSVRANATPPSSAPDEARRQPTALAGEPARALLPSRWVHFAAPTPLTTVPDGTGTSPGVQPAPTAAALALPAFWRGPAQVRPALGLEPALPGLAALSPLEASAILSGYERATELLAAARPAVPVDTRRRPTSSPTSWHRTAARAIPIPPARPRGEAAWTQVGPPNEGPPSPHEEPCRAAPRGRSRAVRPRG